MENELLFLGLLKGGPKHGYEIKRLIKEEINTFFKVDSTSIYYPLRQLERQGLIKKSTTQAGKRPEKYVYSLTPRGEVRFKRLLQDSLIRIERPFFSIDLGLYFISYLSPRLAKRRLNTRLNLLRRLKGQLLDLIKTTKPKPSNLINILRHNLKLLESEIESLLEFLS
ncbi:MAG: PadR family transcriptional regulator [Candidatus Omnitrophota bacterium]